jgi:hypothetical protein
VAERNLGLMQRAGEAVVALIDAIELLREHHQTIALRLATSRNQAALSLGVRFCVSKST